MADPLTWDIRWLCWWVATTMVAIRTTGPVAKAPSGSAQSDPVAGSTAKAEVAGLPTADLRIT